MIIIVKCLLSNIYFNFYVHVPHHDQHNNVHLEMHPAGHLPLPSTSDNLSQSGSLKEKNNIFTDLNKKTFFQNMLNSSYNSIKYLSRSPLTAQAQMKIAPPLSQPRSCEKAPNYKCQFSLYSHSLYNTKSFINLLQKKLIQF